MRQLLREETKPGERGEVGSVQQMRDEELSGRPSHLTLRKAVPGQQPAELSAPSPVPLPAPFSPLVSPCCLTHTTRPTLCFSSLREGGKKSTAAPTRRT